MFSGKKFLLVLITHIMNFACSDVNCRGGNCTEYIEVALLKRIRAPLMADFDITQLTRQLRKLVREEVRQSVNSAVKEEVDNIVQNLIEEAEHKLSGNITNAMSEFTDNLKVNVTQSIMSVNRWKEEHEKQAKVGLSSCVLKTTTYYQGDILKFPDIKTYFGISNTSAFTSTGRFTCEYPGIYLVSVTVMSRSYNAHFIIFKNSKMITPGFVSSVKSQQTKEDNNYHTGTIIIVIDLKPNDIRYFKAGSEIEMHDWDSCVTIIKIN